MMQHKQIFSLLSRCLINKSNVVAGNSPVNVRAHQPRRLLSCTHQMRAEESYDLGPYPRTKEDYLKAARKYNMIPEDYKPLPEEEGLGDYPDIMAFGGFRRDKNEDFTDRMFDRSYGEILHRDADLYDWERIDPQHEEYQYFSLPVRCLIFFGFWATFPILHFTCEYFDLHVNHNRKQEQHPKDGPHYSFELVDSE